jgi:hypothetical protein
VQGLGILAVEGVPKFLETRKKILPLAGRFGSLPVPALSALTIPMHARVLTTASLHCLSRRRTNTSTKKAISTLAGAMVRYHCVAASHLLTFSSGKEIFAGKPDLAKVHSLSFPLYVYLPVLLSSFDCCFCEKGSYYANPLVDQPYDDKKLWARYPSFACPNIWPKVCHSARGVESHVARACVCVCGVFASQGDLPELEPAFKEMGKLIFDVALLLAKECDGVPLRNTHTHTHTRTHTHTGSS